MLHFCEKFKDCTFRTAFVGPELAGGQSGEALQVLHTKYNKETDMRRQAHVE